LHGVPVLIGIGIATALLLHFSLGFTLVSLSVPITSLLVIQVAFYLSMYGVRKRFRQTRDLRTGFIVVGMFCLLIVLAGMYFAERIGLVAPKAFEDDYVEFSIYMLVVIVIGVSIFSFVRPKRTL